MTIAEFPEQTVVFAKDQPEYLPLPAHRVANDPRGTIYCRWKFNWRERLAVLFRGEIWHHILTFNGPLQPQFLSVEKPPMEKAVKPQNPT